MGAMRDNYCTHTRKLLPTKAYVSNVAGVTVSFAQISPQTRDIRQQNSFFVLSVRNQKIGTENNDPR